MTRQSFAVFVPALVEGKGRARATQTGRMYTPAKTRNAESRIELAWRLAGKPRLPDTPVQVEVTVWMDRPKAHFRANGALNTKGEAALFPTRKPDTDNALKLVMDALNGLAWRDDVLVVDARVRKLWADDVVGAEAGTMIRAEVAQ